MNTTLIGWRLIWRNLAQYKRAVLRVLLWSGVGSLPALFSGLLIAAALNHGFLAGHTAAGLAYLAALVPLFGLSAFATIRLYPWCADVVEGVRNNLVTTVAAGALTSDLDFNASGGRSVSRCVEQVEVVRNLLAALARSLRQLALPVVAAVVGLAVLSPILAAAVAPLVLMAMALYVRVVRRVAARQRAAAMADEHLAEQAAAVFAGLRDVTAHGAGDWATARVVSSAAASASAASALAKANTARTLVVALGAQLPLLAVLGLAAVLVPSGRLSIGAAVGAVAYVTTALAPALRTLVHSGGGWLVQLGVLATRIAETGTEELPAEPAPPWPSPAPALGRARTTPGRPGAGGRFFERSRGREANGSRSPRSPVPLRRPRGRRRTGPRPKHSGRRPCGDRRLQRRWQIDSGLVAGCGVGSHRRGYHTRRPLSPGVGPP